MKINKVEKLEKSTVLLEIAVDGENYKKAVDASYAKHSAQIAVPGFRKGKAPRHIVEARYGKGQFYNDAIDATFNEAYEAAVIEAGLNAVARGEMEIIDVNDDGYVFSAKVPVRPEVTLGKYTGIKAEKSPVSVTDEQVNAQIERTRLSQAREIDVTDRPAKQGDTVIFDFEGFIDGKAFDGGKAEGHRLVLGSGSFIPGFEEQLEGKSIGEDIEVNVPFPEDYHEKSLAGKPAVFKCKIHEIKFEELPELDDDFAKDVSEFDTFAEYKDSVMKSLLADAEKHADSEAEQAVVEKICEEMKADIPDAMIEQQIDNMVSDYEGSMRQQGIDLQTYLKYIDSDLESFRANFRDNAEKTVKARLALEEVAKAEKIVVDEAEIEEEYKRIADNYKVDLANVKEFIPAENLTQDISVDKALKFVISHAEISVRKEEKAPKAAKKAKESKDAEKAE